MNGAGLIAAHLARAGVRHVFGVGGANIEDLFAAIQALRPRLQAILAKHEFGAATAADGYARVGGGLGVVLTTSGAGAMNLVPALAEAKTSRVPLLAIVGEPPRALQGRGAFQDISGLNGAIDAASVFAPVTTFCARLDSVEALPRLLDEAIAAATRIEQPGPAVLLVAKDLQQAPVAGCELLEAPSAETAAAPALDLAALDRAAGALQRGPVVIVAGDGIPRAGARTLLARLADALDAQVAVTPDARDAFDNASPRFLGVAGLMGHPRVAHALAGAGCCLAVGTRLPVIARQGLEAALARTRLVLVDAEPGFVGSEQDAIAVRASALAPALRTLLARVVSARGDGNREASSVAQAVPETAPALPIPFGPAAAPSPLSSPRLLAALEAALPADAIVLVDAGNTGANAAHFLPAPRRGHWLLATGMAGMGYSFGAAVGAALATGKRCFVIAGDGAFFMHGFEIHTALEHALPITYVLVNNNAHGMCLVRERLVLGSEADYNAYRPSRLGAGLKAMFPALGAAADCADLAALDSALAAAAREPGPAVVCAEVPADEIPCFLPFQQALAATVPTLSRGEHDDDPRPHRQAV